MGKIKNLFFFTNNFLFYNATTKQTVIKNTFWLGLNEVLSKLIMLVVTISIVRYLGPFQYGSYSLAVAYVAVFMVLSDFGLTTIIVRDVSKQKSKSRQYLSNLLGLKLILSVLASILTIVFLFIIKNQAGREIILAVLAYSIVQSIMTSFTSIFTAWEKLELVFLIRISYYIGISIATFITITSKENVLNLVENYIIATAISIFISIFLMNKNKVGVIITFDIVFIKKLIAESFPLFGLAVVTAIYSNADTLLVGKYLGNESVGFYQAAGKVLFAFQSINIINIALFPRINVLIHQKKSETLNKLIEIILIFSLFVLTPLALIITIFQTPIMKIIYGSAYVAAAPTMALLVWAGVINYFRIFTTNLLFARLKQNLVFWSVTAGTILNLSLNIILIGRLGFVYAAADLVASEALMLIITVIFLRRK